MGKVARSSSVLCLAAVILAWATDSLWAQTKPASPGSKQGQGQQGQAPAGPSQQQVKDAQAIQGELDPDKLMQMVNEFVAKYPESPFLSDVYFYAANAAQQKGDIGKIIDYGEKSLKARSDNFGALLLMATVLPLPQAAQGADADKRLAEAEADANKAMQMISQLSKPPNLTDEQFQQNKEAVTAQAHAALGMVHLERASQGLSGPDAAELSKAQKEYQAAVSGSNPNPEDYFRLGEAYAMDNKIDQAIEAFTKASQLSQGQLQALADQRLKTMKEKKAASAAPPKQ